MMHYCINPLDTLRYYDLVDKDGNMVEWCEVEAINEPVTDDGKKYATSKLHIGKKLTLEEVINASVEILMREKSASEDFSRLVSSGHYSHLAASGGYSHLVSCGQGSQLAASGQGSQLAASGYRSRLSASGQGSLLVSSGVEICLAASGQGSQLAASGDYSKIVASGYMSRLSANGHMSVLVASGERSRLAASGNFSCLAASGENSIVACIGSACEAKATMGSWIVLAEWKDGAPVCVKAAQVDGEKLKADTWYKLVDGEFVEVKND